MSWSKDFTICNLLDYEYFSNHYELITIDLSKLIEFENPDLKQKIILLEDLMKIIELLYH